MTQRTKSVVRQGDVLLLPTDTQPTAKAQRVTDQGRVILAYGEVTGHAHEVFGGHLATGLVDDKGHPAVVYDDDPAPAMELFEEPDGSRILVVKREALVRHEEHGPIGLGVGGYEVHRQREYSPEAIRNVAD